MAQGSVTRKLAAIVAADVVGYSRLMGRDEEGTLDALKAVRSEVFEPAIARHHGRLVNTSGDGMILEFASVVDAVRCCIEVQTSVAAHISDDAAGRSLVFRVGVHLGDVIVEGADLYGDGVNVAARLETLSEPGGIAISDDAYRQVRDRTDIAWIDAGEHEVKNIARPVQVWRWRPDEASAKAAPLVVADKPAIAVLPFVNLSGDPEQEYFADGITEDIITALSYTRAIPVIARNSSFIYKGRTVRIQDVARELGATYVLEGSVRRAGERVRVTAQLIDGTNGHHIWADRYDRLYDDIFDIQDDITLRIALALQPELAEAELKRTQIKRTESMNAWDNYLRGMSLLAHQRCEANEAARKFFQRAIALDPNYGDAWAGIGWSHLRDYDFKCTEDLKASLDNGLEAAQQGVRLNDASAFTHYVLSTAYVWREQLSLSLAELERALELNPFFARAHLALGNRLDLAGRAQEGIARLRRALKLNPRDPERHTYLAFLSRALLVQGRHEEALEWAERAVSVSPQNVDMLYRLAVCLAQLDRVEEARATLEVCERYRPGFVAVRRHWRPYNDDERNARFFAGMDRHGLR